MLHIVYLHMCSCIPATSSVAGCQEKCALLLHHCSMLPLLLHMMAQFWHCRHPLTNAHIAPTAALRCARGNADRKVADMFTKQLWPKELKAMCKKIGIG